MGPEEADRYLNGVTWGPYKRPNIKVTAWVSMEVSNQLVGWVVTYLRDLQPTVIGVIIHLLSKYHGHPSGVITLHETSSTSLHLQKVGVNYPHKGNDSLPSIYF